MTVDPDGAGAAGRWSDYLADWTAWNHARAVTTLGRVGAADRGPARQSLTA